MSHSKEYVTITRSPCVLLINIDNLGILTGCQECIMYILVLSQSSDVSSHTQINCKAAGREHEHTLSIYKELIWACLHNTTFIYYIYYILAINLLFHLFANCILKKKKKPIQPLQELYTIATKQRTLFPTFRFIKISVNAILVNKI